MLKRSGGIAALAGVLVLVCAMVAWEWYTHVAGRGAGAPQPISQITPVPTGSGSAAPASPLPSAAPTPTPTPTPAPVVYIPAATPTPVSGAPAATPTPYSASGASAIPEQPMVAATVGPRVLAVAPILEPPNAPPRILALSLSTPVASGGQLVSGMVKTSSNVASVEARIAGYSTVMHKVGVGKFVLTYRVPKLPFFLHRTYTIDVIARNTRGDAVRSSIPITIR